MNRRLIVAALLAASGLRARAAEPKSHRVAFQIDDNDADLMNEVLNNVGNMYRYYKERGEPIRIEIVAFGGGVHMFRADDSPVKARLTADRAAHPDLVFSACQNSLRRMAEQEHKASIPLVPEATTTPSGVVRLSELQEQGFTYLRP